MIGVSATAGAFFVYELIRYLVAAENVLPKSAKTLSKKEKQVILQQIEDEKQQKLNSGEEKLQNLPGNTDNGKILEQ